ncbi:MAG TPA: PilZ domain-containing protein [Candidatus Acidoferrum sp.]|jgi:hypothetical protein
MYTPEEHLASADKPIDRRFYPRIAPSESVQLNFGEGDPVTIINISENGLLVSGERELALDQVSRILISLNGAPYATQVYARVIWADKATKQSGIQLLSLSEHDREQIRKWVAMESLKAGNGSRVAQFPARPARVRKPVFVPEAALPPVPRPEVEPTTVARRTAPPRWVSALLPVGIGVVCVGAVFILFKDRNPRPLARFLPARAAVTQSSAPDAQAVSFSPTDSSAMSDGLKKDEEAAKLKATASVDSASDGAARKRGSGANASVGQKPIAKATHDSTQEGLGNSLGAAPRSPEETAAAIAGSPIIASTRVSRPTESEAAKSAAAPEPRPATIKMDALPDTELEVRAPGGFRSSVFRVPDGRVLESPSITIRVERAVVLQPGRKWWPFGRNRRKLVIGALVSRVDPETPRGQSGPDRTVRVKATVAGDGHVERVEAISGSPTFLSAAMRAVSEWHYQPSYVDDTQVETESYIDMQFHPPANVARQQDQSAQSKVN